MKPSRGIVVVAILCFLFSAIHLARTPILYLLQTSEAVAGGAPPLYLRLLSRVVAYSHWGDNFAPMKWAMDFSLAPILLLSGIGALRLAGWARPLAVAHASAILVVELVFIDLIRQVISGNPPEYRPGLMASVLDSAGLSLGLLVFFALPGVVRQLRGGPAASIPIVVGGLHYVAYTLAVFLELPHAAYYALPLSLLQANIRPPQAWLMPLHFLTPALNSLVWGGLTYGVLALLKPAERQRRVIFTTLCLVLLMPLAVSLGDIVRLRVTRKVRESSERTNRHLIVPGQSIGPVRLGTSVDAALAVLGQFPAKRKRDDGSTRYTWFEGAGAIAVVADKADRITFISAWNLSTYRTRDRIGPGSTEGNVRSALGQPSLWDETATGRWLYYYSLGVEFEINLKPTDPHHNGVTVVSVFAPYRPAPYLWHLGFSPTVSPADSSVFRQAVAHAIDREAVTRAVAAHYASGTVAASGIEHPLLPGHNSNASGPRFDPARAKALFERSGKKGPITIVAGRRTTRRYNTYANAVAESIGNSLGVAVHLSTVRSGRDAVYMHGWLSEATDFGYPSFALGIAHEYLLSVPEVKAAVDRRDARAVERLLLDKTLIVPIFHLWATADPQTTPDRPKVAGPAGQLRWIVLSVVILTLVTFGVRWLRAVRPSRSAKV
jgi:hypothetical protein